MVCHHRGPAVFTCYWFTAFAATEKRKSEENFESIEFNEKIGLFNTINVLKLQFMHEPAMAN